MLHEQDLLKPSPAKVVEAIDEAPRVKTYYVKLRGNGFTKYSPGKYVMVYVWGFGEVPISLSDYEVINSNEVVIGLTIRASGTVTNYIHENISVGDTLGIRGPYGNGWDIESKAGHDILVVAGGIGLAPLRPLIKHVIRKQDMYGVLKILYGARTPADLLYKNELSTWRKHPSVEILLSVDKPDPGWGGHVGFVTDLIDKVEISDNVIAYICGPEIMMKKAVEKLLARGVRKENIHLSLERRMRCGTGICGSCQLGPYLVCCDGPIFKYSDIEKYLVVEGL